MFSTRKRWLRPMAFYLIASLTIIAIGVAALLWLYNPWIRRPWLPTGEALGRAGRVVREAGGRIPLERGRVVVRKAERALDLFDGDRPIKTYRIALGTNPGDAKRKEGDGCTPEGTYYVCTKNERSRFHLFAGLSYPNTDDAERGMRASLISREQGDAIASAIAARKRPPWNTRLGGEIGLHGGGTDSDWTRGCIALADGDIEELFLLLALGNEVVIEP
jgi:hypothetical protein